MIEYPEYPKATLKDMPAFHRENPGDLFFS
jgi:hypothetical protein